MESKKYLIVFAMMIAAVFCLKGAQADTLIKTYSSDQACLDDCNRSGGSTCRPSGQSWQCWNVNSGTVVDPSGNSIGGTGTTRGTGTNSTMNSSATSGIFGAIGGLINGGGNNSGNNAGSVGSAGCDAGFTQMSGVCIPSNTGLPDKAVDTIVTNFMNWLLAIFAVIGVIAFLISGIQYLVAAGDSGIMETAKRNMVYSIIGIVVGLSGLVIIRAIQALFSANANI